MPKMSTSTKSCFIIFLAVVVSLVSFASNAYADILGQQETFFVNKNYDLYSRTEITATLKHFSSYVNFYVDDYAWSQLSTSQQDNLLIRMQSLATDFDTRIYPIETGFWGAEPRPGIDNDPRITLLLEALIGGNGGYFDSVNSYPLAPGRTSNERDMIVMNIDALNTDLANVFLGHEFQHLISANQKEMIRGVSEEIWLNELRSEFTSTLLNQNVPYANSSLYRRVQSFLKTPSDSLVEWANMTTDYGIAAVFGDYMAGRYGQRILSETLQSSGAGITSINNFLASNNIQERFPDIFADWMVASYLNAPGGNRYGYLRPELKNIHIEPNFRQTIASGIESTLSTQVKYWQPTWMEMIVGDASAAGMKVEIDSHAIEQPITAVVTIYGDGTYDVQRIAIQNNAQTFYLPTLKSGQPASKIMIATTYSAWQSGFPGSFTGFPFSMKASLVDATTMAANQAAAGTANTAIQDGSLIKRDNAEPESYVIRSAYKRYLRPEIIALYGHLNQASTIIANNTVFNGYRISNYVRYLNDQKVYAVWPDGTKHWLKMSAEHFTSSGRDWNSIFIINQAELDAYRTGPDITQ